MNSPYKKEHIGFTENPVQESIMVTRQEMTTYEWRNDTLFKIVTIRQFFAGGSDYKDSQTVIPVYEK